MTAEEFLRDLALRVAPVETSVRRRRRGQASTEEDEAVLGVLLTPQDADRFLDLTGVRVA